MQQFPNGIGLISGQFANNQGGSQYSDHTNKGNLESKKKKIQVSQKKEFYKTLHIKQSKGD